MNCPDRVFVGSSRRTKGFGYRRSVASLVRTRFDRKTDYGSDWMVETRTVFFQKRRVRRLVTGEWTTTTVNVDDKYGVYSGVPWARSRPRNESTANIIRTHPPVHGCLAHERQTRYALIVFASNRGLCNRICACCSHSHSYLSLSLSYPPPFLSLSFVLDVLEISTEKYAHCCYEKYNDYSTWLYRC